MFNQVLAPFADSLVLSALLAALPLVTLFALLGKADVGRADLYLAWDFTVASERNLSERVLAMRDDAMGLLGRDGVPPHTITATPASRASTGNSLRNSYSLSPPATHDGRARAIQYSAMNPRIGPEPRYGDTGCTRVHSRGAA